MDQKARNEISKFRCSAHKLLVKRGRYQNVERNRRICKNCNMNMVEDEYHFLLACPAYRDLRKIYFKKYYYTWPSLYKFKTLMSSKSITLLRNYIIKKYILKKGYAIAP